MVNFLAQGIAAYMVFSTAKSLGPSGFGLIAIALAAAPLAADMTDLGTGSHLVRLCAKDSLSACDGARLLMLRLACFVVPTILLGVITAFSGWLHPSTFLLAVGYGVSMAGSFAMQGLLRLGGSSGIAVLIPLLERLIGLTIIKLGSSFGEVPVGMLLFASFLTGSLVGCLVGYLRLTVGLQQSSFTESRRKMWGRLYLESRYLGLSSVASDLNYIEAPLVVGVSGVSAGGQFAAGSRFLGPLVAPAIAIAQFIYPSLAKAYPDTAKAVQIVKQYVWIMVAYGLVLICVAAASPWLVETILGQSYGESTAWVLALTCLSAFCSAVSQLLLALLQAMRCDRFIGPTMFGAVILGLSVTATGAAVGGAVGAAIGNVVAQVVVTLTFMVRIRLLQKAIIEEPITGREMPSEPSTVS